MTDVQDVVPPIDLKGFKALYWTADWAPGRHYMTDETTREDMARVAEPDTGNLRDRIVSAIRDAAHYCDGGCGMSEEACLAAHPLQVGAWSFNVVSDVFGPIDSIADAVLAALRADPIVIAAFSVLKHEAEK